MELDIDSEELPLRERSKLEKLRRIQTAAAELLTTRSFNEVTMRDVARLARVGEATLFRYVSSKEELLLLVSGAKLEELISALELDPRFHPPSTASGRQIVDLVLALYDVRADDYVTNPQSVTDYVRLGLTPGSSLGATSVHHGDRYIHITERLIALGQQSGKLHATWTAATVAGNCHGIYIHEVLRSPARALEAETFHARIHKRMRAQLEPLVADESL